MARISHYRAQHIPTTGDQPQGTTARSYDSLADSQARSGGCKACLVTALCPVLLVVGHAHIAFVLRMPPVGFREYLQGFFCSVGGLGPAGHLVHATYCGHLPCSAEGQSCMIDLWRFLGCCQPGTEHGCWELSVDARAA